MKSGCKLHMKQQWIISHLCNALEKFPGFKVGSLGQQNFGMTHKFCISQVGLDNLIIEKVFPRPAFYAVIPDLIMTPELSRRICIPKPGIKLCATSRWTPKISWGNVSRVLPGPPGYQQGTNMGNQERLVVQKNSFTCHGPVGRLEVVIVVVFQTSVKI